MIWQGVISVRLEDSLILSTANTIKRVVDLWALFLIPMQASIIGQVLHQESIESAHAQGCLLANSPVV